ncbi:hypothetical protein DUI87_16261 [Hirundo rustica rustica]|uniref:Uncharacterized protein n=1 Tax=Hirundo rustica rustica TaxID=333673 RepID=A0A3M0K684_HIRRU|nr:hypothetical protein DUI87_16261 [Hirundo rustica rustica]
MGGAPRSRGSASRAAGRRLRRGESRNNLSVPVKAKEAGPPPPCLAAVGRQLGSPKSPSVTASPVSSLLERLGFGI